MMLQLVLTFILACIILTLRLLLLLRRPHPAPRLVTQSTHIMVILGSGGHTAEMFALLGDLDPEKYTHRTYIVSSGDNFSAEAARKFEADLEARADARGITSHVSRTVVVPRARKIHQSILSTPWSCLVCAVSCFRALVLPWQGERGNSKMHGAIALPDVIVTNGPATAVIVVVASMVLRFVGWPGSEPKMRTIYVESWARVKRLSLSGRILINLVDRFVVQWDELKVATKGKAECLGCLVGGS